MKVQNNDWLKDFEEFMSTDAAAVPAEATEKVVSQVHDLMNPNIITVFLKILVWHLAAGYMSLAICHQFDMNPFNTQYSLDNWFMSFTSHEVCMVLCGGLFVSVGLMFAGYFLSIEEVIALKKNVVLQTLSLGLLSLGLFLAFGANLVLSFSAFWLLGVIVGGVFSTLAIFRMRAA